MTRALKICVAQPAGPPQDHGDALRMVAGFLEQSAGADLLALPELALCGYGDAERIRRMAAAVDSAFLRDLGSLSKRNGTGLIAGLALREGETLYNAAVAIGADGEISGIYRKVNLWGPYENGLFTTGAPSPVIAWNGLNIGMLICHDLDFPATARDLVLRGADTLVVLSATNHRYRIVADAVAPARAYENVSYVVYADAAGEDGSFTFLGHSRIIAPDGTVLARLDETRPAMARGELDAEEIAKCRSRHPYLENPVSRRAAR
ncbi:hypothetical protein M8R20_09325 [Pseudomonas sp. R2.Fl]|nr:hypothetical protein [Pseudomonas sp. R2.Fl]